MDGINIRFPTGLSPDDKWDWMNKILPILQAKPYFSDKECFLGGLEQFPRIVVCRGDDYSSTCLTCSTKDVLTFDELISKWKIKKIYLGGE